MSSLLAQVTAFFLWINTLYLRLTAYLNQTLFCDSPLVTSRYGKFVHKIVVIGDDFAYGVGDTTRLGMIPGVAHHLHSKFKKEVKLKHAWELFNQGRINSTSYDWLPRSELNQSSDSKGYFDKVFSSKRMEFAEVVIVMIGFNDARAVNLGRKPISAAETVQNVKSICKVLRNLGKDVWVCTPCTNGDKANLSPAQCEENLERVDGIAAYLTANEDGVAMGPRLDANSYEFKSRDFYSQDGVYFTKKAYIKLSKDFNDMMLTSLIKREFESMKALLGL
ncbi:hypothetical protein CcCBS67573_g01317 [Chytriomyces confervae]|uniref:SGNH hydrolase-type esterase domain-containing protein n=1 Tax=Chytriomyces confervae TaxID=246404 RepID=A0A507FM97_9FUNG|nr:hypothetical protein HDU80_003425 [Chytriomyces hyalinus]TPX77444.1 hypothetical protein CcCBS67573_g01317 [Chytriomyces confervae]